MKILVDMGHPAHVHFFKNMIWKLEERGHEIKITARKKDVTLDLLDAYGFDYFVRGVIRTNLAHKALDMLKTDYKIYKFAKEFKPDILLGVHNPYIAQVGWAIRKPSITFTDTEISKLAGRLTFPFTNVICTPSCFQLDLGEKQVRYDGYQELAYLHPNYFKPDSSVLDDLDVSKDDSFMIFRFVSWGASHDFGNKGINIGTISKSVKKLEGYGKVLITSEAKLPKNLEKYKIHIPPEKVHDVLYYASMYIGDGATMASEAAVLGTPSIYLNPLMLGYTNEEEKYGLLFNFPDSSIEEKEALRRALELLNDESLKKKWQKRKERLLNDKIDVTKFMTEFVENYPQSFYDYQRARNE